jgi:hypothetical protein
LHITKRYINNIVGRGDIVKRGAGWNWGDQDGGVGGTGMVEEVKLDGSIWVLWANATRNVYQVSDLEVVGHVQNINIGDIVERGPDWKYGDQDSGPGAWGVVVDFILSGLVVVCQWENGKQDNYRWGYAYDLAVVKSIRFVCKSCFLVLLNH